MENKAPVSVILPIKSSKVRDFDDFFNTLIQSINDQSVGIEELVMSTPNSDLIETPTAKRQYAYTDYIIYYSFN